MKTLVLYKTQYGSTKEYAQWLAESLACECLPMKASSAQALKGADRVLLGSSVAAGKLSGSSWIKAHEADLAGKKLALFSVSGAAPNETKVLSDILDRSISPELRQRAAYFPLQGRQVFAKLPWLVRVLMKAYAKRIEDPKVREGVIGDYDFVKRENLATLIEWATSN